MTNGELIAKLQELPLDLEVICKSNEDCWGTYYDSLDADDPQIIGIKKDKMEVERNDLTEPNKGVRNVILIAY